MTNLVPELTIINGKPTVTSRQIAEDFGRAHCNVIRDIESLQVTDYFREYNFVLSEYTVSNQTRKYKQYLLTRDGFTMLVMGFSGKKATQFKEAYINAFNQMEAELSRPAPKDYLSDKDYKKLSQCLQEISHNTFYRDAWLQGSWAAIRKATGSRSPEKYEIKHLPAIATELTRILKITVFMRSYQHQMERDLTKLVLRGGQDLDETIDRYDREYHAAIESCLDAVKKVLPRYETNCIQALINRD